jgi:hypothetical protein
MARRAKPRTHAAAAPVNVPAVSDELADQWHVAVCKELESRVKNRDFWLWVTAETPDEAGAPEEVDADSWKALGDEVAEWLGGMSADRVDADDPPKHEAQIETTRIELAATPKKPNRRGTDPLVLNLYPGMTYFTGSHSAGPAPELPDDG